MSLASVSWIRTRYELRRRGQVVALEPLALRVLAYFVQHPGQAVAKGDCSRRSGLVPRRRATKNTRCAIV